MAEFIDNTSAKHPSRGKSLQTVRAHVLTHINDHVKLQELVASWPETFQWQVTSADLLDGAIVESVVTYTARGANRFDITRRLPLEFIIVSTETVKK